MRSISSRPRQVAKMQSANPPPIFTAEVFEAGDMLADKRLADRIGYVDKDIMARIKRFIGIDRADCQAEYVGAWDARIAPIKLGGLALECAVWKASERLKELRPVPVEIIGHGDDPLVQYLEALRADYLDAELRARLSE